MSDVPEPFDAESRISEIESRFSLSEDLLDTLNLAIYRQQQQIERLEGEIRSLRERLEALGAGEDSSPRRELPPHY